MVCKLSLIPPRRTPYSAAYGSWRAIPRANIRLTHGTAEVPSTQVANAEKILKRMRANPRDSRIEDRKVLAAHSIEFRQPGSSHVVFIHRKAGMLTVPAARQLSPCISGASSH